MSENFMIQKVSVVGLGKLGACMAACFAMRGFSTIGVDVNPRSVEALQNGEAPVDETDLQVTILKGREKLRATLNYHEAISQSDATFVIVPTPSEKNGDFSLKFAKESFRQIGKALKEKNGYHLVVMTSTVLPGRTELELLPILEKYSGKKSGKDFGLCYSPEFIALGSVIRDFLNPDFVLIGAHDKRAGDLLSQFYKKVCPSNPPVALMNLANAELTKIAVNTFMTMKISFANLLTAFCEKIPGGNVEDVTGALALFGGVGKKSLKGGLGYGGPCLPRDNVALAYFGKELGIGVEIPETIDRYNRSIVSRVYELIINYIKPGDKVAVLGLAYKPHTWVVEESQGMMLAQALSKNGYRVSTYDPKISGAFNLEEALDEAKAIIVTTPDPQFKELTIPKTNKTGKPVVIDVWRFLSHLKQDKNVQYVALGEHAA